MRMLAWLAVFVGTVHSPDAFSEPECATLAATVTAIGQENISVAERDRKLEVVFDRAATRLIGMGLADLPDGEVEACFNASYIVATYTLNAAHAGHARRVFDELAKRGIDAQVHRKRMFDAYLAARMLDPMLAFASMLPEPERRSLPGFVDTRPDRRGPTVWHVSTDAALVTRHDFALKDGVRVVVTGSPWCPFSRAAASDIEKDPHLLRLMERHAAWLVPQQPMPNFRDISRWNTQHPSLPLGVVYSADEWPAISNWATPVFYFFENGQLRGTVTGWPGREQGERLLRQFEQLEAP